MVITAKEFCDKFFEVFDDCMSQTSDRVTERWNYWTAFMTGKKNKIEPWNAISVLPSLAEKLGMVDQLEFMRLDSVFCEKNGCPLNVAIEHENDWRGFDTELERLFSVRAQLKVGITYAPWLKGESAQTKDMLQPKIKKFFDSYVSVPEHPDTEYLFLLGDAQTKESINWHRLIFTAKDGPSNKFTPCSVA